MYLFVLFDFPFPKCSALLHLHYLLAYIPAAHHRHESCRKRFYSLRHRLCGDQAPRRDARSQLCCGLALLFRRRRG